ncbi:MAG: GNAT family protein [Planctomycetota bacterium]|nr:GNAT family protein [Planctomycetota bacterium]
MRPTVLNGRTLRLEPLSMLHAPGLAAIIDADTFAHFPPPFRPEGDALHAAEMYIRARAAEGLAFAMVLQGGTDGSSGGRVVGASCYLDVRPQHRGLEIGATFIARDQRGTRVNPEAKLLMLGHAFDTLGCVRVQLKCDARNLASAAAIAKLGAVREGVLRRHMVMHDGFMRDTVMFSITDAEWPGVRQRLLARLGYPDAP